MMRFPARLGTTEGRRGIGLVPNLVYALVTQWQSADLPSLLCGSDSRLRLRVPVPVIPACSMTAVALQVGSKRL